MFQQVVPYRIPEELWAQAVFNNGTGGTTYCTGQEINDPGQEVPGHRLPGQEVPGHRHPGQEVPGQEVPGHRHPGQEVPGHRPAQEAQRPPPAKRSPATTTSTTPYTKGRFSVSRIDTPPHEAEHIFINQENGNRASQTPKKSRKSFLVSTLKKTQLRRSRKLEALEVMRSRRRSGATEANLFVKKSWADVVKFGVTQPQKQSHNPGRKAKMTKRRTKIKVLQTPAQKMKAQIRTGHADSPATIVIGRAHSRTVHLTGHIPKVVKNYALKLNLDQDESFTGMSELFNSPLSDKQRSSCLEGNQNDMTQNKSSIDQTSVLQTPEESGDMVVSPLNITSVTTERPYNRDAVSRLLRSPISTELHKGNDQILETVMQMGGITRPTTECKVKKIKTPPKKRETIDLTGIKRITPKQKGKPVTDPVALKRLLRTPRQMESLPVMYTRRSPQQVEDLVGIKRIMKTPKQKGEPVEDLVGIKRIMRTPKQKGESVEDLVGIKRIMRTPKQKGESVEDLVGIKEIMRTPRQEEEPVEDMVGIKHIMKTPKLKGRPVEDLMGISHIMRTPPRENTHPIEEIIGIKQLKKTPQKKSAPVKELDVMPLSETRTSKTLSTKTTYSRSTTSLGQLGSNHSISNELSQDNWLKEMQHLDASENNAKSTPARRSSKSLTRLSNSSTQGLVRPEVFPQDKTYRDSSVESFFAVNKTIPSRISQRQPTSMGETNKAEVQRLPGVGLKDVKSPTGRGRSSKSWTHSAEDLEESEARISDDLPQSNKLEASTEAQVQESVPVSSSETPTQSRRRGRPSKSLTRLSSSSAGDLEASVARISDELPQNNRPEASTAKAQVQESVPVSSSETPTPSRRRGRPSKSLTRLSSSSEGDLKESDSRISDELPKNDGLEASTAKAAHVPESVPVSSSETPTPSRRRGRPSNSLTRLSSSSAGDLEASVARISDDLPQNNRLEASKAQVQESVPVSSSKTPTPSRRRGRLSKSLTRLSSSSAGGLERPNTFPQDETYRDSSVQHPFAVNKTQSKRSQRQLISMGDLNKAEVHTETKVQKFPAIALNEVNSTPIGRGRSSKSLTRSAKEDLEASVARISNELPQNNQLEASTAVAEAQESVLVSSNETPTPSRRRGRPSKSLTRLSSSSAGGSKQPDPFTQEETGGDSNVRHPLVNKTPSRSAQRQLISMGDSTKTDVHSETEVQKLPSVALKEVQSPTRSGRSSTSLTRSAEDLEASDLRISDELPQNNRLEASTAKAAQVQASTPVSSSETPTPSRRRGRPSKSLTRLSSPRQLIRMGDSNKAEVHTETEVQKLPGVALKEVKSTSTGRGRSSKSLTRSAKEDLEESEARISDDLPQSNKLEASTEAQVQETVPVSSSETPTPSRRRGRPPKSRTHLSSSSAGGSEEPQSNVSTGLPKLNRLEDSNVKHSPPAGRPSNRKTMQSLKNLNNATQPLSKSTRQNLQCDVPAGAPEPTDKSIKISPVKRSRRRRINLEQITKELKVPPMLHPEAEPSECLVAAYCEIVKSDPARRKGRQLKSLEHLSASTDVLEEPKPNFADSKDESRDKSSHVGKRTINIRAGRSRKNVEVAKETTQKIKEQADIPNSLDIPVKITQAKRSQRKQINLQPVPKSTAAATTAGEIQNASSASSVGEQLSLKRSVTRNKVEDTVEQSREETILQRSPKKHAVEIRVETEILTSHTALVVKSVRTKNTAKKRPVRKPSQISPAETKEFNVITESEETLLEDLSQTSNNTMEAMWKNNENVLVEEQTVKSPKHKATRSTRQHQKAMLTELTAEAPTKQLRGRRNKTTAQDRLHLNITLDKGDLVLHEDTAASTIVTKSVRRGRHARGSNTNSVTELIKKESANENLSALSRQDVVVHEHKRSTDGGPVTKTRRVRKKQNLEGNTNVDSMDQHDSADVASVDIKEIFTRSTCGKKDPPQAEALHTETGTRLKGRKPANVKNKLKAMDDSVQISTRQNIEKENSSIPKSVHWHPLLTNMETSENNLSKETVPNNENKISNRSIRSRGKNKLDMPEATIPAKRSRRGKIEENTEEGSLNQSDTGKSAEMSETDSSHSLVSIKESIKVTKRGRNKMETNQNTPLEQIITVSKGSLEGHTEKSKEDPERIASTMDFKETVNDKTINKRNIGKRNITLANPLPSSGGQRDLGVDSNMTIDENLRNRKLGRRRAVAKNLDGEKKEQDKVTEIPISNQRRGRRASSQTKVHDGSKSSEPFSKNKVSSILETKGTEAISTKSRLGLKRKIANAEVVAEIPKACEPLSYTIAKSSSISKSKTQNATSARGRRNIRNISTQNEEAAISPKENGKASKQSPAKNNKTEAASITTQKKRGKSKVDAVKSGKATQVVKTRASARTRK
ncbi:hypothetical protein FKM82_014596 [Ascaphus truei]